MVALTFLILLKATGVLLESCNNVTDIQTMMQQYKLEVSASFSNQDSVLSLNCTITNGDTLLLGQELVWSEGGLEINGRNMTVHQSDTSTVLTIYDTTPGVHYGEYGCQCQNRYNYTHNILSKAMYSGLFKHHCSNASNIIAVPKTISTPFIIHHYVSTPGQAVHITCNQSEAMLMRICNGSMSNHSSSINISSPSDQGKLVCMKNSELLEIYYVTIKNYKQIQFVFPHSSKTIRLPFAVGARYPPSLCAVYSPLPLTYFEITFKVGLYVIPGLRRTYSTEGPLEGDLWSLTFIPNERNNVIDSIDLYCSAGTVWESVTAARYRVNFDSSGKAFDPAVCVTASLTPSFPAVTIGSIVTVHCTVEFDIAMSMNVIIVRTGKNTTKILSSSSYTRDTAHSIVIEKATSVKDKGDIVYTCKVVTDSSTIIEDSIALQVVAPNLTSMRSPPPSSLSSLSLLTSELPAPSLNVPVTENTDPASSDTLIIVASVWSGLGVLILTIALLLAIYIGCIVSKRLQRRERGTNERPETGAAAIRTEHNHYIFS